MSTENVVISDFVIILQGNILQIPLLYKNNRSLSCWSSIRENTHMSPFLRSTGKLVIFAFSEKNDRITFKNQLMMFLLKLYSDSNTKSTIDDKQEFPNGLHSSWLLWMAPSRKGSFLDCNHLVHHDHPLQLNHYLALLCGPSSLHPHVLLS